MKVVWTLIFTALLSQGCNSTGWIYCMNPGDVWTIWPVWDEPRDYVFCFYDLIGNYTVHSCPYPFLFNFNLQLCVFEANWQPPPPPNEITPVPPRPTTTIPGQTTTGGINTDPIETDSTTTGGINTDPIDTEPTTTGGINTDPIDTEPTTLLTTTTGGINTDPIETESTTQGITIDPPPNLGACLVQRDLYFDQIYLKTMCLYSLNNNYEGARFACHSNGMNLFIIENALVQSLFFNATSEILSQWEQTFVWINGRQNQFWDIWTVQDSEDNPMGLLYDGMDWVDNEFVDGRNNGPCLRYSSEFGRFQGLGMPCEATSWGICEHFEQQSTPPVDSTTVGIGTDPIDPETTTQGIITPPTTESPPNIGICTIQRDLFNDQTYLKSLCLVDQFTNYDNARISCQINGMNLFIINNALMQTLFFNATTEILTTDSFVWINGRRNEFWDLWVVFNSGDTPIGLLYQGMDWVRTDLINGRTNGPCLRYSSEFGEFQGVGMSCEATSWFICEHSIQQSTSPSDITTTTLGGIPSASIETTTEGIETEPIETEPTTSFVPPVTTTQGIVTDPVHTETTTSTAFVPPTTTTQGFPTDEIPMETSTTLAVNTDPIPLPTSTITYETTTLSEVTTTSDLLTTSSQETTTTRSDNLPIATDPITINPNTRTTTTIEKTTPTTYEETTLSKDTTLPEEPTTLEEETTNEEDTTFPQEAFQVFMNENKLRKRLEKALSHFRHM